MTSYQDAIPFVSPVWTRYTPIIASRAEGCYVYDLDGNPYLDFTCGIGVTNTGHCHPKVVEAIREQAGQFIHAQANIVVHHAIINARRHWRISQEKLNVDRILSHLKPFVPETVKKIVEKNPAAPSLDKKAMDVSILFLDVAGYTRISETLTQEKVHFIIEKYFSSFLDVIYAHGGDVNETAGDGLMVIFQGDPRENAVQAARAALAIQRATEAINRELQGRFDPIAVNMGINSGTALVGAAKFNSYTGSRWTYTPSGSTTNLAARLGAFATRAQVCISKTTAAKCSTPSHEERTALSTRSS